VLSQQRSASADAAISSSRAVWRLLNRDVSAPDDVRAPLCEPVENRDSGPVHPRYAANVDFERHRVVWQRRRTGVLEPSHVRRCQWSGDNDSRFLTRLVAANPGHTHR